MSDSLGVLNAKRHTRVDQCDKCFLDASKRKKKGPQLPLSTPLGGNSAEDMSTAARRTAAEVETVPRAWGSTTRRTAAEETVPTRRTAAEGSREVLHGLSCQRHRRHVLLEEVMPRSGTRGVGRLHVESGVDLSAS